MGIKIMAERKPPEFRFNVDDQEPDEFYQEEMKDLRVEKLGQRITLISILLPCLIAVAIYLGYRDLTDRVHQGRDDRNLEVQQLSKQMETLSEKFNEAQLRDAMARGHLRHDVLELIDRVPPLAA